MREDERLELRGLKLDWDAARTQHALERVQRSIAGRRRAARAAIACAVIPLLALIVARLGAPPEARVASTSASALAASAAASPAPLRLRDGSEILPTAPNTDTRVVEESPSRVSVVLSNGAARYAVTPNPTRSFVVRAGAVTVTVLGTEFVVELRADKTFVDVTRGSVRVSWGDQAAEGAVVAAGHSGLFPPDSPSTPASSPAVSSAPASGVAPPASQVYRSHVALKDYDRAYAVLAHDPSLAGDTVEELLVAADVARLSNHPAQAVPYLRRVVREHAGDDRAPLAAFTLGRTLSGLGRLEEAGDTFARLQRTWPRSAFAEDALARQVETAVKLGQRAAAARLAEQYVREYPNGRRVREMRARVRE